MGHGFRVFGSFVLKAERLPHLVYFLRPFVNTLASNPDCLTIERKVPIGISFRGVGTTAVCEFLRYLA